MIYFCCDDERRRNAVKAHPILNGIDFLEVRDLETDPMDQRQRTLLVHFLKDLTAGQLMEDNIRVDGGERIKNIKVTKVSVGAANSSPQNPPAPGPEVLIVEASDRGDFSNYTLRLVKDANSDEPPAGFDPILSAVDFSFKVGCPSDFDCKTERVCKPDELAQPEISYLAKDYASFRQLMLDRMALLTPQWRDRNPADLGIALIELLAYAGDYLSYQQDALATETYLRTARRRASVRRHARLIDYFMHDGRNARVWVHITAGAGGDGVTLEKGEATEKTKLLTRVSRQSSPLLSQSSKAYEEALAEQPLVFELLHDLTLYQAHNKIQFYTWESRGCCLAMGATRATLQDDVNDRLRLCVGDVLIFEERKGPKTGIAADADPSHRHAVMLTRVFPEATVTAANNQPLRTPGSLVTDPLTDVPVVQVEWSRADALPFPLCISGETPKGFDDDISLALGNIVLADHGMTLSDRPAKTPIEVNQLSTSLVPPVVPKANPVLTVGSADSANRCSTIIPPAPHLRYRPRVARAPITHAAPYSAGASSANALLNLSTTERSQFPLPCVWLSKVVDQNNSETWNPRLDLLSSHANAKEFVVEVEVDGTAYLRFGDDLLGARPVSGTKFLATYRIGNGAAGNIGADTLAHLVSSTLSDSTAISAVRNPLHGRGGIEQETIEQTRQNAPSAFRVQERAVTPADYEEIALRPALADRCGVDLQRVAATPRWTGSWHTMFLTVDRLGGEGVDVEFEMKLRQCLERYRMAGQDLEVDGPQFVSLEIEMAVCVTPGYFFSDVKKALLDVFSDGALPDNSKGVFHPDNLSFRQTIYLSALIAAAQRVEGVNSVTVRKFQRQHVDSNVALSAGKLELGRLEIARLSNDPNFPERGSFTITHG